MRTPTTTAMRVLAALLSVAAALVFVRLWTPLVLAAWFADLLGPAVRRLERILRGRRRGAAAVVVLLTIGVLLPFAGVVALLVSETRELLAQERAALEGQGTLGGFLLGGVPGSQPLDWAALATRYGANAWRAVATVARASATAAIDVLVFVGALYTFAADGERAYAWLEARAPISRDALERLSRAFRETGRGLIVAGGGTALVQGAVATAAYLAIGVPRALLLGPLTALCAIVPVVGTTLVWVPLAVELAVSGEYKRAALLVVTGIGISTIDNVVRPVLARHGRLALPTFVVLVSMLGGIALFGAAGALLGPLLVRLCVEALAIVSEGQREEEWRPR